MFSSSLRHRPVWSVLEPLLKTTTEIELKEAPLDDYDFVFPVLSDLQGPEEELHIIVITEASLDQTNREETIRALKAAKGKDARARLAIVFLHSGGASSTPDGRYRVDGLMALQALLFESLGASPIPIIPVPDASAFFPSIKRYCDALVHVSLQLQSPPTSSSALDLLRRVAAAGPLQQSSQHDMNVLSDLFSSLRALSSATRTEEGRQLLFDYLGVDVANTIIEFFEREWVCG